MISSDRSADDALPGLWMAVIWQSRSWCSLGPKTGPRSSEGALGEPAAERAIRIKIDVVERGAKAEGRDSLFLATTSGRPGLMIFDMQKAFSNPG
jgi:hypothetical protein